MIGWLHPSHINTAMGTPQIRCRLMHQSGRVAIMLVIRSLPHAGSHTTLSISSIVNCRNVVSEPSFALHRLLQRDEPLLRRAKDHRIVAAPAMRIAVFEVAAASSAPRSSSSATITGFASHTVFPSKGGGGSQRPRLRVHVQLPRRIHAASSRRSRTSARCRSRPRHAKAPCAPRPCPGPPSHRCPKLPESLAPETDAETWSCSSRAPLNRAISRRRPPACIAAITWAASSAATI